MNYLTAIIAFPLFFAIWAFEVWLFMRGRVEEHNVAKLRVCLVVSTLQMVSCWFWLFGFVYSTTNDFLSEAMEEGEEMNCFGLVGAEVLLAIFQMLFSQLTFVIYVVMRRIRHRVSSKSKSSSRKIELTRADRAAIVVAGVILAAYTVVAFATARNRRCPQNHEQWLISVQHHFYPVYLVFDSIIAIFTLREVNVFLGEAASSTKESSSANSVRRVARFFRTQCKVTVIGAVFGVLVFVIQFSVKVKALSVIACVFCVAMYVTYAMRRVPMVAMWVGFDIKSRTFKPAKRSIVTTGTNATRVHPTTGASSAVPSHS